MKNNFSDCGLCQGKNLKEIARPEWFDPDVAALYNKMEGCKQCGHVILSQRKEIFSSLPVLCMEAWLLMVKPIINYNSKKSPTDRWSIQWGLYGI